MAIKHQPPKWADRFLNWYCNPQLLEEIQGDAYELHERTSKESKRKADFHFIWNVIRFFRWKNIRRIKRQPQNSFLFTTAMFKNIFLVTVRNFFRQPVHALLNLLGLTGGFVCVFLILLWVSNEFSFDKFHDDGDRIYKVLTQVDTDGSFQTFDVASVTMDVSSIAEVEKHVSVSDGTRWPHVLCFRPEDKPNECVYQEGIYASESFFSVFNFPVIAGDINPIKKPGSIAISESMARRLYGTENPVGKTMKIDTWVEATVTSVFNDVPANSTMKFEFVMSQDVLKKLWGGNEENWTGQFFSTYVKTNTPTLSVSDLTERLNTTSVLPEALKLQKIKYSAYPFMAWHLKNRFEGDKIAGGRIEYVVLFVIIGILVLIMAVINFVNMSTARATTRAKEIGIRKVTGAYRGSIIFQFLSESFMMVLAACLLALLTTHLSLPLFNQLLPSPVSMNWYTGWEPVYIAGVMIFTALAAGLYPAFVMSSFQPVTILKGQLRMKGSGSERLRKSLLVVQLSVSAGIIIFSGVMYYQLNFITQKSLGFERSNTIRVEPTANIFQKFESFKNELKKNASIVSIGAANLNPLTSSGHNTGVNWQGKPADLRTTFQTIGCSYEFPATIGLKVLEGRNFESAPLDSVLTEVMVSENAVKLMGLTHPVGEHIQIGSAQCVIIGVVNNFHTESLHKQQLPVILYRVDYMHTSAIYIRYQPGTTQQSVAAIQAVYKMLEPTYSINYWFQDETFDELYKTETTASRLVLLFTIIAIVISVIGVVGLSTFNAMRRTREMSIRRVFGATMTQVLALLSNEFSSVMLLTVILAGPVSWYAADRWLGGFVYHTPVPWWIFPAAFAGLTAITLAIICLQGYKTAASSPAKTLRSE